MIRATLRGSLHALGFRQILETGSFAKLHDLLQQGAADLVVASSELEGNQVGVLVREMRNQRLGENPFVVIITLLTGAEPDYVKDVIDSGPDDLLLMPSASAQLTGRIEKLVRIRKPFVVTHDYTGPDRRTKARSFDSHSSTLMEVPNPLKLKAENASIDVTRLNHIIAEAANHLNKIKVERHAIQLEWLLGHISATIRDGVANDTSALDQHIAKLVVVTQDMLQRMRGTPSEAHLNLVSALQGIAKTLAKEQSTVSFTSLEQAAQLARKLKRALSALTAANQSNGDDAPTP